MNVDTTYVEKGNCCVIIYNVVMSTSLHFHLQILKSLYAYWWTIVSNQNNLIDSIMQIVIVMTICIILSHCFFFRHKK